MNTVADGSWAPRSISLNVGPVALAHEVDQIVLGEIQTAPRPTERLAEADLDPEVHPVVPRHALTRSRTPLASPHIRGERWISCPKAAHVSENERVKDGKGRYIEQLGAALDALTDYQKIERAGQMLATETYGTIVPIGGTRDLGRDGVALVLGDQVHHLVLAVSAQGKWQDKIRKVARRVRDAGEPIDVLVYCTPEPLRDDAEFQKLRTELAADNIRLEPPLGRDWWIERLSGDTPKARAVRREILGLPAFHPGLFRTVDEYEEQFAQQRGVVLGDLVARQDCVDEVTAALKAASVVIFHGPRGLGKTRVTLAAARSFDGRFVATSTRGTETNFIDDLATLGSDTVVVDDAHSRLEVVQRLADASTDPNVGRPAHLLLVTWTSTLPAVRTAVARARDVREVEIGRLGREELAAILKAEPIRLDDPALRAAVLDASEGYPLYAVMGALALAAGADPTKLRSNPLEAYLDTFWERAPTRTEARVLALVALRGGVRVVDHMGSVTDDGKRIAAGLEISSDTLIDTLNAMVESGVLNVEEGAHVLRPDALARLIIARLCLGHPPHADLPRLLELAAPQWDRAIDLLTEVYEDTRDERVREAVRPFLEVSVPGPDADAHEWSYVLRQVRAVATLLPGESLRFGHKALAASFPASDRGALGFVVDRPQVRTDIIAIADQAKYRDLPGAIRLLLDVSLEEPFDYGNGGSSQRNAPAIDHLVRLAEIFDVSGQRDIPGFIRRTALEVVRRWREEAPDERSDMAVLVLGSLLDPALSSSNMDPDKPGVVNMTAGHMGAAAYAAAAEPLVQEIERALPSITPRGGRALFAKLSDVAHTAKGHARAFNARPTPELADAAREIACRLLAALRIRFAENIAVQVRAHRLQVDVGCSAPAPLPDGADEVETLFTYEYVPDHEASEKRRYEHIDQITTRRVGAPVDETVAWYMQRARWAFDAGLELGTQYAAQLLFRLAQERPEAAIPLARAMHRDDETGGWADVPLRPAFLRDPASVEPLLREWLAGDSRERSFVWNLLAQDPAQTFAIAPRLVADAITSATDEDAMLVEVFMLRIAGHPGDAAVLGLLLRAPAPLIQRVGVVFACLLPPDRRHTFHAALAPEDRDALIAAMMTGLRAPSPLNAPGILMHAEETMKELAEVEPEALMQWVRLRLAALHEPKVHYMDPFAHGELAGVRALRGRVSTDGLLDDYAALDDLGVAEREGWEEVLQALIPDPTDAILARLQKGGLDEDRIGHLLKLAPRGARWTDVVAAAAERLSADELTSAVHTATFGPRTWSGSPVPLLQAQVDFFDGLAQDARPKISEVGRRLAASYRNQVERAQREEQDRQYRY